MRTTKIDAVLLPVLIEITIRPGDNVIVVGGSVVAVQQVDETVFNVPRRLVAADVLSVLRQAPMRAIRIGDELGIARDDRESRGMVSSMLRSLLDSGAIRAQSNSRMPVYEIVPES